MPYALQVVPDADHDGQFHWLVLEEPADTEGGRLMFTPHSAGAHRVRRPKNSDSDVGRGPTLPLSRRPEIHPATLTRVHFPFLEPLARHPAGFLLAATYVCPVKACGRAHGGVREQRYGLTYPLACARFDGLIRV